MVTNTGLHRWCDTQSLMNAGKIVVHIVKCNRCLMILNLLIRCGKVEISIASKSVRKIWCSMRASAGRAPRGKVVAAWLPSVSPRARGPHGAKTGPVRHTDGTIYTSAGAAITRNVSSPAGDDPRLQTAHELPRGNWVPARRSRI